MVRKNLTAAAVGLAATIWVVTAHLLGWLDWLEFKSMDLRVRYANSIPEDPADQICCIDIDDGSVASVGAWPWTRDLQAALISVPAELGARAIVVDLTFNEPATIRAAPPPDADLTLDPGELLAEALPVRLPDTDLRDAIGRAGNVFLAVHYSGARSVSDEGVRDVERLLESGVRDESEIARRLNISPQSASDLAFASRLIRVLADDPNVSDVRAAEQLQAPIERVRRLLESARQIALLRALSAALRENPALLSGPRNEGARQLYETLPHAPPFEQPSQVRAAAAQAVRNMLGLDATIPPDEGLRERIGPVAPRVPTVVPVYFLLARAARGCGFVAFDPDSDGVMRRTAIAAAYGDRVMLQLAFRAACELLGASTRDISAEPGRVVVRRRGGPPLVVQVDAQGRALVPFVPRRDWTRQFGEHVPADAICVVHDLRETIVANERDQRKAARQFFASERVPGAEGYRELCAELDSYELALDAERLRENESAASLHRQVIAQIHERLRAHERQAGAEIRAASSQPAEPAAKQEFEALVRGLDYLAQRRGEVDASAARYQAEIDRSLAWLRARVDGRVCVLGYSATSVADMTPIPTHPRAAGMIAHANLINGMLTGRLVTWATPAANGVLAGLLGATITLMSLALRPRAALLVMLMAVASYGLVAATLFYTQTYLLGVTPAIGAMATSYMGVAVYRYIFVDRERRQLTTALSQYTSATLARQMAEKPELCKRAETREVTAIFTDLAGFTSLSEQIGAERTQRVLNVALGRFSEAMLRHEAMINKFIGDGIFAFWNPVIYPQPDHASRAVETAIDLFAALDALRSEMSRSGGDEAFAQLALRVGVATGNAVVGPCGSEDKYDYTCIGDSVNVASRLESANKVFGTRILVSGATRAAAGDGFAYRPLGGVQVKGKLQAVPVFELLGRSSDVSPADVAYAEQFGAAVRKFQSRDFRTALEQLEACRALRPDDKAAGAYVSAAADCLMRPPPDDWNGGVELHEK